MFSMNLDCNLRPAHGWPAIQKRSSGRYPQIVATDLTPNELPEDAQKDVLQILATTLEGMQFLERRIKKLEDDNEQLTSSISSLVATLQTQLPEQAKHWGTVSAALNQIQAAVSELRQDLNTHLDENHSHFRQ
jgi:hypothetical protein